MVSLARLNNKSPMTRSWRNVARRLPHSERHSLDQATQPLGMGRRRDIKPLQSSSQPYRTVAPHCAGNGPADSLTAQ
jgi:hypothetical protein